MKAVGCNGRGIGNQPAVQGLLDLQRREDPDILFLSETKLIERDGALEVATEDAKHGG